MVTVELPEASRGLCWARSWRPDSSMLTRSDYEAENRCGSKMDLQARSNEVCCPISYTQTKQTLSAGLWCRTKFPIVQGNTSDTVFMIKDTTSWKWGCEEAALWLGWLDPCCDGIQSGSWGSEESQHVDVERLWQTENQTCVEKSWGMDVSVGREMSERWTETSEGLVYLII